MHSQTVCTASLMSEVSLGHIDTCGTHRVCLHVTLSGGHLGGFTHDTPAWHTSYTHLVHPPASATADSHPRPHTARPIAQRHPQSRQCYSTAQFRPLAAAAPAAALAAAAPAAEGARLQETTGDPGSQLNDFGHPLKDSPHPLTRLTSPWTPGTLSKGAGRQAGAAAAASHTKGNNRPASLSIVLTKGSRALS